MEKKSSGVVIQAFGNLLHVKFDGDIKQGEVCFVKINEKQLASEVIEIKEDIAKVQVFEDTSGIKLNTEVEFSSHLLEAELGPGLLTSIFDGLQNPLEKIAQKSKEELIPKSRFEEVLSQKKSAEETAKVYKDALDQSKREAADANKIAEEVEARVAGIQKTAWKERALRSIDPNAARLADEIGARLLADIAHPAGLIATGLIPSPIPHCHIVTSTTHKTLRGPRGGLILVGKDEENDMDIRTPKGRLKNVSEIIDSNVFPGFQGGPLMHVIAAKAVAFREALQPDFVEYQKQVIKNAQALANRLMGHGFQIVSGGTDTHVFLMDLRRKGLTGKDAERALENAGITANKNMVPFDTQSPFVTSGIRLGTPALTTRGMKEEEMRQIADMINRVLEQIDSDSVKAKVEKEIKELCRRFPLYS